MKKTVVCTVLAALGVLVLSFVFTIGMVKASDISVGTYDVLTGEPRDVFSSLESVRIIAESSHKPITITVIDPEGNEVGSETVDSYIYNDMWSGITEKHGWYTVEASSPMSIERVNFATVFFNVVPEAPLGAVSIALVMFSAFGFYGLVKRKRKIVYL